MGDISRIEDVLEVVAGGGMVILVDDEDRENEGDLVVAAAAVEAEHINFMARHGRGLICLALTRSRADALGLAPMVHHNTAPLGTAFTVSIDLNEGGGIGSAARAATIRAAIDDKTARDEFVSPGHIFPLRAREGGVLVRTGQTEGSVDLARLAGLPPAGVICEIMNEDGTMARLPRLLEFSDKHDIPVITVADLIRYRLQTETLVEEVGNAKLPTAYGEFTVRAFRNKVSGQNHLALCMGERQPDRPTLVRVHRSDTVTDVFGVNTAPADSRLAWTMRRMASEGAGVLLYIRPEGSEEPLDQRVRRYGALTRGERVSGNPLAMSFHDFGVGAQILKALGLGKLRVITSSSPRPFRGLSGYGLEIVDWIPITGDPTDH